jgi:hypothetical protein
MNLMKPQNYHMAGRRPTTGLFQPSQQCFPKAKQCRQTGKGPWGRQAKSGTPEPKFHR